VAKLKPLVVSSLGRLEGWGSQMRSFDIELSYGAEYGDTSASVEGQILVSSRMPMRDSCVALLAAGADPEDRATFRRDGRLVGSFKIEGPTRWPDQPPPHRATPRIFTINHARRPVSANRAGGLQHRKAFGQ
jgi:hypothetical protein